MTTKEKIAVLQAYQEGKRIQSISKFSPKALWEDVSLNPFWNFYAFDYRIKPEAQEPEAQEPEAQEPEAQEPKLRPYANAEEFLLAQKEHGQYLKFETLGRAPIYKFPIYISDSILIDSFVYRDYSTLLDEAKWQDGTPCGIMEE